MAVHFIAMNSQAIVEEAKKEVARLQRMIAAYDEGDSAPHTRKRKVKGKRKPMSQETKDKIAKARKAAWAAKKKAA